jgi:uncharacterized membrane protein YfhO
MKIRKNGKVINLTESDLRRIVKRLMNEQSSSTKSALNTMQKIDELPNEVRLEKTKECIIRNLKNEKKLTTVIKDKINTYKTDDELYEYITGDEFVKKYGDTSALNCLIVSLRIYEKEFEDK